MKKRKTRKNIIVRSRHFRNIILSLLITVMLVLIIVAATVYNRFIEQQRQNSVDDTVRSLKNIEATLSKRLLDMKQLSIVASRNPVFAYYPYADNKEAAANEIISQLQNYRSANGLYMCIGFRRSSEPNILYTSLGCYEQSEFDDYLFSFKEKKESSESAFLSVEMGKSRMPGSWDDSVYRLTDRIDSGIGKQKKQMEFYIAKSELDTMFRSIVSENGYNLLVFDDMGKMIYSLGNISEEMKKQCQGLNNEGYTSIKIGKEDFACFSEYSSYNNWHYVSAISNENLFKEYNHERFWFLRLIMISLFIAIFCSAVAALLLYRPIWEILGRVTNDSEKEVPQTYRFDDIGYIKHAVDDILRVKEDAFRSGVLLNLLWDQYDDPQQAEADCEEASVGFLHDGLMVGVLDSERYTCFDVLRVLSDRFASGELISYAVRPQSKASGYFILNFSYESDIKERVISIIRNYTERLGNSWNIGLSYCQGGIMRLGQIFTQAKSACRYISKQTKGGNVALYSDIEMKISSVQLSDFKKNAQNLIAKSDLNGLSVKLDRILNSIPANAPIEELRFAAYGIIAALSESAMALDLPAVDETDALAKKIVSTSEPDRERISDELYALCRILCEFTESRTSDDDALLEKINEIISRRMCDQMLTLETFSEECNVSPSYLGRYFKQKIGTTPMRYINMKKMEYSKELLRETDLPLNDIVAKTGYIDVSNFIRKFKLEEGVTPIGYRKQFREDNM